MALNLNPARVNGPDLQDPVEPSPTSAPASHYLGKGWLHCLLLAVVGFVVRVPALQGQLVWDDDYLVRSNQFIKSPVLIFEAFRHYLFLDSYSKHYRPVQNLSYMADYFFWNSNFYGFHLSNILFHVGSGLLLYLLLRKLFAGLLTTFTNQQAKLEKHTLAVGGALLVSLLWVVHPAHSAAIDYISGRADSVSFFFACAAWLLFLQARERKNFFGRGMLFTLAWFSGLLGLCSRESACIWVIIFIVHFFALERRLGPRSRAAVMAACLLLLAAYIGLRQLPIARPVAGPSFGWPVSLRLVLMLRALGDYGRVLIFPSNLHMERTVYDPLAFHSENFRAASVELEYLSIIGLALAAGLCYFALQPGQGRRVRIFGAAWFFLAFLPISNLIDLNATVAEHWLYLPSVGFLIFLAGCVMDFPPRWRHAGMVFGAMAVIALSARSFVRSSDWISNETFARRTLSAGGASIRLALLLAQSYSNRGDYVEAEKILRKALQMSPDYPIARNNLADALSHLGKEKEAESLLADAAKAAPERRKEYPRTWIAALNFAHALHTKHNDADALVILDQACHDYPETWELISAEAELLRQTNKPEAAIGLIRPFAQNHWWHYNAWLALGRACAEHGDAEAAAAALGRASRLDIHETAALNLTALIRFRQKRFEEACQAQQRAVARQPDEPTQYILLSNILDQMGRADDARAALAHVSRLRNLAAAHTAAKEL
jgi:protein O-mannosyl-transferase